MAEEELEFLPDWPGPLDQQESLGDYFYEAGEFDWPWDDPIQRARFVAKLDPRRVELKAVWVADGEICNGGFTQFLDNSFGELAEEAILGFRRFGMNEFAELLDDAFNQFVRPIPHDRGEREKMLHAKFGKPYKDNNIYQLSASTMDPFSDRYYDLVGRPIDRAGFLEPICKYIDHHRDVFFRMP